MAERMRKTINKLFNTGLAAKAFDYLASELKPRRIAELKNYLGAPLEDTYKALEHLEKHGFADIKRSGLLRSDTSVTATITSKGIRAYKALKEASSRI